MLHPGGVTPVYLATRRPRLLRSIARAMLDYLGDCAMLDYFGDCVITNESVARAGAYRWYTDPHRIDMQLIPSLP